MRLAYSLALPKLHFSTGTDVECQHGLDIDKLAKEVNASIWKKVKTRIENKK